MSSLSRSSSFPCRSLSFPHDLITETVDQSSEMEDVSLTTDFITQIVNEHSGQVQIRRFYHEHLFLLSTYLKVNENVDEYNFCCLCKFYFTVGDPIYSCFNCYMFLHKSCAELPSWIDSTRHPQHRLQLKLKTTYEDRANRGTDSIFTSSYGCYICKYNIDIKDALQSIPISLFKNSYLNLVSSSLPLYLKKKSCSSKEEDLSIMVSRKVDQIDHFFHEHPLILSTYVNEIEEENEGCHLCGNFFNEVVPIYSCNECNFFLHESCAGLPALIKSTFHPEHLLYFRSPTEENVDCYKCDKSIDRGPRYRCEICKFAFHFECVLDSYLNSLFKSRCLHLSLKSTAPSLSRSLSFPMDGKRNNQIIFSEPPPNVKGISLTMSSFLNFQIPYAENVDQVRHFSHEHPLVFMIFKIEYNDRYRDQFYNQLFACWNCGICGDDFLPDVPFYGCLECGFFLHKSCAKLPETMRNTLHPAHMLQLIQSFYPYQKETYCQICDREICSNYYYRCTDCRVDFDSKCASTHNFEDHKKQEHTFQFFKASLFTCDACGITENKKRVSCVCTKCPLRIHVRCSNSFPRTVKQNRHHHKLNLTYSFEIDFDYAYETCKICFNEMNNVYCMYQCPDCTYIAHVSCATSKEIVEDELSVNKIEGFVTAEDVEGNQVNHFSHPHDLIFTNKEAMIDAYCDACVSLIYAPFYACATDECNFYLHKQCFELPLNFQHPLHEHRLTLTFPENYFTCYGCNFLCNGLKYSCARCCFDIDVRCSLLSDSLKHDGHECTLTLIDYKYVRHDEYTNAVHKRKCSACDGDSYGSCMFSCRQCDFHLELGCALLPKRVTHDCPKHGWKAHPLELTYGGIENISGVYICDGCEESRCISHWFYDCGDCVWSNHPQCVLGKFQFKYGKTYEIQGHSHKLQLVKKALMRYRVYSCDVCKKPLTDDSPLFCAQCNLYFHGECTFDSEFDLLLARLERLRKP